MDKNQMKAWGRDFWPYNLYDQKFPKRELGIFEAENPLIMANENPDKNLRFLGFPG